MLKLFTDRKLFAFGVKATLTDIKEAYSFLFIPFYFVTGILNLLREFAVAMLMDADEYAEVQEAKVEKEREELLEEAIFPTE